MADKTNTRYPYTYAADYLRMKVGDDYGRGLISRAAAAQCKSVIAAALGLDERYVAQALADAYIREENAAACVEPSRNAEAE